MEEKKFVAIEIDIPEYVLFGLMLEAHDRDITLNQYINIILEEAIVREMKGLSDDTSSI